MSDVLARILGDKRRFIATRKVERSLAALEREAAQTSAPRGFIQALRAAPARGHYGLIAEIKRASPSRGLIRADFDPVALAQAYDAGGASCLSVLTDEPYFQGHDEHLVAARAAVALPVLRKDFILDPYQVVESRALGADCILLIMAAIDDSAAAEIEATALDLGMDVLIEVHDEGEAGRAGKLRSRLVGINNRNLATLDIDLATSERLVPLLPSDALIVSESGLREPANLARMDRAGIGCFLVGESLMRAPDVAAATRALLDPNLERAAG